MHLTKEHLALVVSLLLLVVSAYHLHNLRKEREDPATHEKTQMKFGMSIAGVCVGVVGVLFVGNKLRVPGVVRRRGRF